MFASLHNYVNKSNLTNGLIDMRYIVDAPR